MNASIVPDMQQATDDPTAPLPMTFGPCPKCDQPMRLGLIEPAHPNHDLRTYECDACGHSEAKVVKYR
jgi:hypothetical protein